MEIHDSRDWTVDVKDNGEIIVTRFEDGHYCGEIVLNVDARGIKVIRSDDE